MPYESIAQEHWAHTPAGTKALGGAASVHEWDEATKGKHLPEHKMKSYETDGLANHKSMAEKKHPMPKHKMRRTITEHHNDGTHNTRHEMHDGSEVGHASPDDKELLSHMSEMLGAGAGAAPAAGEEAEPAAGAAPGAEAA